MRWRTGVINELRDAIGDEVRSGERMNRLVDEFREGRDTDQLLVALDSEESEIVSLGAWILGELPFERYSTDTLLLRLWTLTSHGDPSVRFHALMALFPALLAGAPSTDALLARLIDDPDDAVSKVARSAKDRLSKPE